MNYCDFCPYDHTRHDGGRRPVAARNKYGDRACDRHVDRLWAATAEKKGLGR